MMKRMLFFMLCVLALAGCISNVKKENAALHEELSQRRAALKAHQQQGLEQAQRELAATDSLLDVVSRQHDQLHEWVMAHATVLTEQSAEVVRLNGLRAERDSLKERFEVLCETIKYIRKKQKE